MTALVFVQALSLQILCFCGHCPRSQALGISADAVAQAEPVHACCRQAQVEREAAAAQISAAQIATQACCGDAHSLRELPALVPIDTQIPLPTLALLTVPMPSIATRQPGHQDLPGAWVRSTGPPGAREPLFVQFQAFLI